MRNIIKLIFISFVFFSCQRELDKYPVQQADWNNRRIEIINLSDYSHGKTYLPVYSHIYHSSEHRAIDLTATVSIRNVSMIDSIYILKANYYNTVGDNIRQYVKKPIYLRPLETLEIIIAGQDVEGGSGANFVFDWAMKNDKNPPLFEAVMIGTGGQQGLSFTTRGVQIFK